MSWLIRLLLCWTLNKRILPQQFCYSPERFGRTLFLEAQLIRCVLDCSCFSPSSSETSFSSIVMIKCKSRIFFFSKKKKNEERGKESRREEQRESRNSLKLGWEIDSFICLGHIYDYTSQSFSCHCRSLQALSVFYLCCSFSIEWVSFYSVTRDCILNMCISVCTWLCYTRCLHGWYNEPFGITYFYFVHFPTCRSLSVHQKYSHDSHVICATPWT